MEIPEFATTSGTSSEVGVELAPDGWIARDLPQPSPKMLWPRQKMKETAFPFDQEAISYFFLARNAIFALCNHWRLRGSEVLFPSYFHGVELDALLAAGVRPRFYPVDRFMHVDVERVMEGITPQTSAIYLIHYLGFPGPASDLADVCRDRGIKLIEDCALSLLSKAGARPLGSFGDASIFCLYKTLPLPTGGALVMGGHDGSDVPHATESPPWRAAWSNVLSSMIQHYDTRGSIFAREVLRRGHALARPLVRRVSHERVDVGGQDLELKHVRLGMNRISHTILSAQPFAEIVQRRRSNYQLLHQELRDLSEPIFESLPSGVCPLFFPIRVNADKEKFIARLRVRGVDAINFWCLSHRLAPRGEFPEVDSLRQSIVELPCHQDLQASDMIRIAEIVKEEWAL